jgi:hypothetical protein
MSNFIEEKVLNAVLLKNLGFWDMTSTSGRFERSQYPHLRFPLSMKSGFKYRLKLLLQNHKQEHDDRVESTLASGLIAVSNDRLELNK